MKAIYEKTATVFPLDEVFNFQNRKLKSFRKIMLCEYGFVNG